MSCYLVFDVANLGTLHSVWSHDPVPDALAVVHPTVSQPSFKFTLRGGRSEVIRKIRDDKKRLMQGWCEFIKIGKETSGRFELLGTEGEPHVAAAKIVFNRFGEIVHTEPGEQYNVLDFSAVSAAGPDSVHFDAVKSMLNSVFLDIGVKEGHSLLLT